jgi:hypothetical protein
LQNPWKTRVATPVQRQPEAKNPLFSANINLHFQIFSLEFLGGFVEYQGVMGKKRGKSRFSGVGGSSGNECEIPAARRGEIGA